MVERSAPQPDDEVADPVSLVFRDSEEVGAGALRRWNRQLQETVQGV
jgi:hypothetical protein